MKKEIKIGLGIAFILGLIFIVYKKSKNKIDFSLTENTKNNINLSTNKTESVQTGIKPLAKSNNVIQIKKSVKGDYAEITIPKGTVIENMSIAGLGGSFIVDKTNEFDDGIGFAKFSDFDVVEVKDRTQEIKINKSEFPNSKDIIFENNGFKLTIGTIVKAKLKQDITRTYPIKPIIFT